MQTLEQSILDFLSNPSKKYFILKGAAGTGKSYTIKNTILNIPGYVFPCVAFTNKAVNVLKRKNNIELAFTFHKAFYKPETVYNEFGEPLTKIVMVPQINQQTNKPDKDADGKVIYIEKEELVVEYKFSPARLLAMIATSGVSGLNILNLSSQVVLVVDESSMVPSRLIYEIIERTPYKIIFVGDHNQLPPVDPDFDALDAKEYRTDSERELYDAWKPYHNFFSNAKADWTLDKIYRQGETSTIIGFAQNAINGGDFSTFNSDDVTIVNFYKERVDWDTDIIRETLGDFTQEKTQIICYKNDTASKLNSIARSVKFAEEFKNLDSKTQLLIREGDKLYVDKRFAGVDCDGSAYEVTKGSFLEVLEEPEYDLANNLAIARCRIDGDHNSDIVLTLSMRNMISRKPKDKIATVSVIWGYCITCHKSQGSEWPYVIVVDEGVAYNRNKWLYTAITRASENLVMFVTGGK